MANKSAHKSQKPAWEPTPAEIAAECEKIRAGWPTAERMRRANKHRGRVEVVSRQVYRIDVEAGEVE